LLAFGLTVFTELTLLSSRPSPSRSLLTYSLFPPVPPLLHPSFALASPRRHLAPRRPSPLARSLALALSQWILDTLQKVFSAFKASPSWNRSRPNVDYGAWSRNARNEFQVVPQDRQEADLPAPPGILDDDDEEEDARVVLGDEEEMLGEPQRKEKGQERFRDDE